MEDEVEGPADVEAGLVIVAVRSGRQLDRLGDRLNRDGGRGKVLPVVDVDVEVEVLVNKD